MKVVPNEQRVVELPKLLIMLLKDFLNIQECPVQRDTEGRAKKKEIRDKFKILKQSHLNIFIALLTEDCRFNGKLYKKGTYFLVDGHTRRFMWSNGLSDISPPNINAIIHPCSSIQEVIELYEHCDNSSSTDKGRDKLFGACKINEIKLSDSKLTGTMPLSWAAYLAYPNKFHKPMSFSTIEFEQAVRLFKDPLVILDTIVGGKCGLKKSVGRRTFDFHKAIITASLMMLEAYGIKKESALMDPLVKILIQINLGGKDTTTSQWAGSTHIVNEFDGNATLLTTDNGKVLFDLGGNKRSNIYDPISYVLYWIEKELKGIKQKQVGSNWRKTYQTYASDVRQTNVLINALGTKGKK